MRRRNVAYNVASAKGTKGKSEYLAGSMVYSVRMLSEQIFGTTWVERDGKLGLIRGNGGSGGIR